MPSPPKNVPERAAEAEAVKSAGRAASREPSREPSHAADFRRRPRPLPQVLAELPRPIGLLGFGEEGKATLAFLRAQNVGSVHIYDRSERAGDGVEPGLLEGATSHLGESYLGGLDECRTLIRSPGIRPDLPELARARAAGARVTSAVRLFLAACPGRVIGVTGTLGKGTTVALIGAALEAAGVHHRLGGNLGTNPLLFLDQVRPADVSVLELSSFQLMDLEADWPEVAVILRTTSEHLDWHRDVREYRAAKAGLVAPLGYAQRLICCADAEGSCEVAGARLGEAWSYSLSESVSESMSDGIAPSRGHLARIGGGNAIPLPELEQLALPGEFNRENAAAALLAVEALAVEALGVPEALTISASATTAPALQAIAAFPGLPHRLERVCEARGVLCVNDSYATRPEATIGALAAFGERPLALILGGSEKHADFSALAQVLRGQRTLRRILLIGATAQRLAEAIDEAASNEFANNEAAARPGRSAPPREFCASLEAAVASGLAALGEAGGGVLLLSPACASFGMFPNYKVRGERFRALALASASQ